jgi:hypothetical protein
MYAMSAASLKKDSFLDGEWLFAATYLRLKSSRKRDPQSEIHKCEIYGHDLLPRFFNRCTHSSRTRSRWKRQSSGR